MLEIQAGRGGEEARLFAAELLRMYLRFTRRRGLRCEIAERADEGRGLRSATLIIEGGLGLLRGEAGEHIVQRKTRSRRADRIHTSHVAVRVLVLEPRGAVKIDRREIRREAVRGSGPGGQHRNRRATAIRLTHLPSGITASCDTRSQKDNEAQAMRVLEARLAAHIAAGRAARRLNERRAQAKPRRIYDFVRGMIRERSGGKTRKLERVLDGRLELLPS